MLAWRIGGIMGLGSLFAVACVCVHGAGANPGRYPHLTSENRLAFTRRIQPILFNCCGSQACHGRADASALALKVPARFGQLTPLMTEHNLTQVLSAINFDKPEESPLLLQALRPHGGRDRPPLPNKFAPAYRVLEEWVLAVAGQPVPAAPSNSVASGPSAQAQPVPPPSPRGPESSVTSPAMPAAPVPANPTPALSNPGHFVPGMPTPLHEPTPVMPSPGPAPPTATGLRGVPGVLGRTSERPLRSIGFAGSILPGTVVSSSATAPTLTAPSDTTHPQPAVSPPGSAPLSPQTIVSPVPAYTPAGVKPVAPVDWRSNLPRPPSPMLPPNGYSPGSAIDSGLPNAGPKPLAPQMPQTLSHSGGPPANTAPSSPVNPNGLEDPFDPEVFNRATHRGSR
jgi:hypothetical protein